MSTWVQWMRYGGTEVANVNRTTAYLRAGLANDPRVQGYDDCDCEAIDEGPYLDPATDEAPWYTSTRAESGDFLGLILNQIDMGPPWARKVTPRGGDGSSIGPLRLRGRTIGFRGLLYAASPQAMDYGRRWLSEVLAGGCDGCGVGDLCMLPACPEDEVETDRFFRTLKRAALIDGPTDLPLNGIPCDLIQEVAFQFATEVGYLYEDPSVCMEDQVIVAGVPECCVLTTEEWIGDATAKITVVAGSPNRVEGLRIVATPTKDLECPVTSTATPCSEFVINNLIPGTKLVIDGTERTVEVREVTSDRIVGGLDVVTPAEGLFQFVDVGPCSSICLCSSVDGGGQVNANTRISIEQSNRET